MSADKTVTHVPGCSDRLERSGSDRKPPSPARFASLTFRVVGPSLSHARRGRGQVGDDDAEVEDGVAADYPAFGWSFSDAELMQ